MVDVCVFPSHDSRKVAFKKFFNKIGDVEGVFRMVVKVVDGFYEYVFVVHVLMEL